MAEQNSAEFIALSKIESRREDQPKKAGRRKLIKPPTQSEVKSGLLLDESYKEQDIKIDSKSSLWKEYFLDNTQVRGLFLDNNILIWFRREKVGQIDYDSMKDVARKKYPDANILSSFVFGERKLGISASDLMIKSEKASFDPNVNQLVDYFGRSLDWNEQVRVGILYNDRQKVGFSGSMQQYLVDK
jgi:hypothetical protein